MLHNTDPVVSVIVSGGGGKAEGFADGKSANHRQAARADATQWRVIILATSHSALIIPHSALSLHTGTLTLLTISPMICLAVAPS